MIIGLTGNIGSGKSSVARYLKDLGAEVVDTDRIARDIVGPGKPALSEITHAFGSGTLRENGTLDRAAVAELVFSDAAARKKLNEIMHPRILQEVKQIIDRFKNDRGSKAPALVIEAPLLLETGMDKLVDEVWLVTVDKPIQLKRITARDKVDEQHARRRIESQMPQAAKLRRAHRIIANNNSPEETRAHVMQLWHAVTKPPVEDN